MKPDSFTEFNPTKNGSDFRRQVGVPVEINQLVEKELPFLEDKMYLNNLAMW